MDVIGLFKLLSNDTVYRVLECVKENPGLNASTLAKILNLHTATVQRYLEVLERYGVVSSKEKRKIGRPSKIFFYEGGEFSFSIEDLLGMYSRRKEKVREKALGAKYSFDVRREIITSILVGGKKISFDETTGRFLWNVPPPDSDGKEIEKIAEESNLGIMEAVEIADELLKLGIIEVIDDE